MTADAASAGSVVLADTSIWIDHLHRADRVLTGLLDQDAVATHPLVIEELALGTLARREALIESLERLQQLRLASHEEVLHLVATTPLWGRGLSAVDTHLLASVLITPGARLWTRDKRLNRAAADRGRAFTP